MSLLVGDATATYSVETGLPPGYQEAFRFVATQDGTVDTLSLKVSAVNASGYTSIILGIYSDAGGSPDALLAAGAPIAGPPAPGDWVTVAGLSVDVAAGQAYWLAFLPLGGNVKYATAVASGGSADWSSDANTFTSLQTIWPTTSPASIYTDGPLGFTATGVLAAPLHGEELRFQVTSLRYPAGPWVGEPVVLAELEQFTDGEVGIPINDGRDGKVTLSVYDDAYRRIKEGLATIGVADEFEEYVTMLRAFYGGRCVLWAPITNLSFSGDQGTITMSASDKIRLEDHQVVLGDEAIDKANPYGGRIPVDYRGLRLLRDAAINLPAQTTRGVPDIGIDDGTNTQPNNDVFITIERGTDVWSAWQDLVAIGPSPGHDGAPDFELEPLVDRVGYYSQLNTYSHQGTDKTAKIVLHYGFGRDNLTRFDSDSLGKIITHQHAVSNRNGVIIRVTRASLSSSSKRGLYVRWDVKDYTGSLDDLRIALGAWAQQQVDAYAEPPRTISIDLRPEDEIPDPDGTGHGRYRYLRDFKIGDEIHAEAKKGYRHEAFDGRIVKVTLKQADQGKKAAATLDLVPNVAGDGTGTEDD